MSEPRWLSLEEVLVIHERQLAIFGGAAGMRDQGALESALSPPRNKGLYEDADLPALGASLAYGIVRNHAFVDGNKRAAFLAMAAFLRVNGLRFAPSQESGTAMMLSLAAGEVDETGHTRWILDNIKTEGDG
jgi:death-on-curing protein